MVQALAPAEDMSTGDRNPAALTAGHAHFRAHDRAQRVQVHALARAEDMSTGGRNETAQAPPAQLRVGQVGDGRRRPPLRLGRDIAHDLFQEAVAAKPLAALPFLPGVGPLPPVGNVPPPGCGK
jgi:hypothetical protein